MSAVTPSPIHIRPTAALAERALLPGDPGRALALAQELLDEPRMFNHNRGLWGYTGTAPDGETLTIQSTGMGGPSAAIVLTELANLGLRRAVRVGTCGALDGALRLGQLVVAHEAIGADGTSAALLAGARAHGDERLCEALARAAGVASSTVVSSDLFYDPRARLHARWRARGAVAVEMEAAALFAVGRQTDVRVGCVLAVTDLLAGGRTRIDDEGLARAGVRLGQVAASALATSGLGDL